MPDDHPIVGPAVPVMNWHPPVLHPGGVPLHVGLAGNSRRVGLYHQEIPPDFPSLVRFATDESVVAAVVEHDGKVPIIRFSSCYHVERVLRRLASIGSSHSIQLDLTSPQPQRCRICGEPSVYRF